MEKLVTFAGYCNLTPHEINVTTPEGESLSIPPSGIIARVAMTEASVGSLAGIPLIKRVKGQVEGLESLNFHDGGPHEGLVFVVSAMVLDRLSELGHQSGRFVAPDTGNTAVRNERGQVVAVTRWVVG